MSNIIYDIVEDLEIGELLDRKDIMSISLWGDKILYNRYDKNVIWRLTNEQIGHITEQQMKVITEKIQSNLEQINSKENVYYDNPFVISIIQAESSPIPNVITFAKNDNSKCLPLKELVHGIEQRVPFEINTQGIKLIDRKGYQHTEYNLSEQEISEFTKYFRTRAKKIHLGKRGLNTLDEKDYNQFEFLEMINQDIVVIEHDLEHRTIKYFTNQ